MSAWKDWSRYAGGREEEVPFSCLRHLVVQRCPELTGTLPYQLDHLIKLEIHSCWNLNDSTGVVHLPSLCELYIRDCNKEILKWLDNLTSLTILQIANLAELFCFDSGFMSCLVKLKKLHIRSCDKLTYLWHNGDETRSLTCLQELAIYDCPRFTSFVVREGEIELPCNLERMELGDFASLERLPSKMHALRHLSILSCPKIRGLTIPPNDPSSNNTMSQLEYLQISHYDSPISFPFANGRLVTLKTLGIEDCKGMESLEEITVVESPRSLDITRCSCPALKIEDFPPLPITLSHLGLYACSNIKSLPNQWHHLTSLQSLKIVRCENIICFPEGGLPPNLQSFFIWGCDNMKQPVREWGLSMLTSLERLDMDGSSMGGEGDKVWFPSVEDDKEDAWRFLFPSSLTYLHLSRMRNVERLSNGLCNHLSSLQRLWIEYCLKLRDLPEDGLPLSLHELWIQGCSKLTGDYWPHIQEIPRIAIDNHPIWGIDSPM
ncbi:hypothetical protein BT93_B1605 [Corymbia citriodora subsp. variegata]|nr:hypothetical protein BT93_B1605 [Corymbia citriodora subsp. variegata]